MNRLSGEALPQFERPISKPFGHSPLRRPASVRRTSTIDAVWPEGPAGATELIGAARDLLTLPTGEGKAITEDRLHAFAENRRIESISCQPGRAGIENLVGSTAGSHLRSAIAEVLPGELEAGTPLYLLLDDLAGATLVAGWAYSRWPEDIRAGLRKKPRSMEGICIGFRPGSGALAADGTARAGQNTTVVLPLSHPEDPQGWHQLVDRGGVNFRRARRIDVWRNAKGGLSIDSGFQDSASSPSGERDAIHEYRLEAAADEEGRLVSLRATPGTLPFPECRAAPVNIEDLLGTPLDQMRHVVLSRLHTTFGCTHLNDMLRALAEVPILAEALPR